MTRSDYDAALQRIQWRDGRTPVSDRFNDTFYSVEGGRCEVRHVFINGNNLAARWTAGGRNFDIAELGFGTGLNFLETWFQWQKSRRSGQMLTFTSFEMALLSKADMRRVHEQWDGLVPLSQRLLQMWQNPPSREVVFRLDSQTALCLVIGDAHQTVPDWKGRADCWYLDGFAPAKNPQMWSASLMKEVFLHTQQGGGFATYTSAGWVRRNLESAGFAVSKGPGFGSKRDMIYGIKPR